jgi:hypothetical protein
MRRTSPLSAMSGRGFRWCAAAQPLDRHGALMRKLPFGPFSLMCAGTQRLGKLGSSLTPDRKGSRSKEGIRTMTQLFRSADAAEMFSLEHHFPFAGTMISLFMISNVGSAILMLIAQA